jgi:hypothetical protein
VFHSVSVPPDFLPSGVFNKVSHPYKTTDKIMVLRVCVLIFIFLNGRQEDKSSEN